jgi:putative ABC transport system substrate-binding protein
MQGISMRRREFIAGLGGAAAWPVVARAQQGDRIRRIGVLMGGAETDPESKPRMDAFQQGLEKLGWTAGRNAQIDVRWTMGDAERTRSAAAELVNLAPDVIFSGGSGRLAALQRATRSVPIVFVFVADPVAQGFVASLARPGGNITGFSIMESTLAGKWVELLKELAPHVAHVAFMFNPETAPAAIEPATYVQAAAQKLAIESVVAHVRELADIDAVMTSLASRPGGGLIIPADSYTTVNRKLVLDLAARYRLPAIYPTRSYVADGGLASYGVDAIDPFRQAARYVDRILRGEKPADLAVQQPTKFELVINMKTAKALGLTIPETLLATADEVIQ